MPLRIVLRYSDASPASLQMRSMERLAQADRETLGLRFGEPCDPRRLVELYDVRQIIESLTDYAAFLNWDLGGVVTVFDGMDAYSAVTFATSVSDLWMLVNPGHERPRRTFTIAHEFGHLVLGHRAVGVDRIDGGLAKPRYSDAQEHEAYAYALALLLPYAPLLQFLEAGASEQAIARHYGVSVEALHMRLKLAGLWETRRKT